MTSIPSSAIASGISSTRRSSRSEEHTSELQAPCNLVCRLLLEKKIVERLRVAAQEHARGIVEREAAQTLTQQARERASVEQWPSGRSLASISHDAGRGVMRPL